MRQLTRVQRPPTGAAPSAASWTYPLPGAPVQTGRHVSRHVLCMCRWTHIITMIPRMPWLMALAEDCSCLPFWTGLLCPHHIHRDVLVSCRML